MVKPKKKKPSKPAKAKAPKRAAKKAAKKKPAKKPAPKPVTVTARVPAKPDVRRRPKSLVRRAAEGAMRSMPRIVLRFGAGKYDADLDRNPANFQSLTPLTFLERAASVFPNRTAIIHGKQRYTYAEYYARSPSGVGAE